MGGIVGGVGGFVGANVKRTIASREAKQKSDTIASVQPVPVLAREIDTAAHFLHSVASILTHDLDRNLLQ